MDTIRNIIIALLAIVTAFVAVQHLAHVNREHSRFVCATGGYVVQPGDTIYNIVIARCEGNLDNAIYQTVKLNGGALIHPGQTIYLPSR